MPINYLQHRCAISDNSNRLYFNRPSPNKSNVSKTQTKFNPIKTLVMFFILFSLLNSQINVTNLKKSNNKFKS